MRLEDDPRGHPNYAAMDAAIARFVRQKDRRHAKRPEALKKVLAAGGAEITVSTCRPLVRGPYTTDGYKCPHGTTFWIEPTGDQIARWAADGTP